VKSEKTHADSQMARESNAKCYRTTELLKVYSWGHKTLSSMCCQLLKLNPRKSQLKQQFLLPGSPVLEKLLQKSKK